ncbi:MAG TPA: SdpA family antimicrobial peptide system protein [Thermoanaerobaculia bacterium]|nr:SdpA family antimicrobial peptide system protein [Thermoanaerobaculia bacterium]
MNPIASGRSRVRRVLLAGLVVLWSGALLSITVTALPYNPLTLQPREDRGIKTLMPEGWGFFTRDPREPDLIVFVQSGQTWRKLRNMPISSAANSFGIDRFPRAQSVELAMLLHEVDEDAWRRCSEAVSTCLRGASPIPIVDRSPRPTLEGTLALVRQEPIPWAWSANAESVVMPSSFVVIEVRRAGKA